MRTALLSLGPVLVLSTVLAATADQAAEGVTDRQIVVGMSAPFKGASRSLGIELYRGSMAYLSEINRAGGVHGRTIALSNVDKHAEATKVDVCWDVHDGVGVLSVTDNGRGFDPATGVRESAYGLVGMRERADVIGARLVIDSQPGSGTSIEITASNQGEG